MDALTRIWWRLSKAWAIYVLRPLQIRQVQKTVEHLHGPLQIPYAENELIVLCLLRDGALYINSFVRYYTQLGVRHIYFMDNGSQDETVSLAKQYPNVTILRCLLPFRKYKMALRHYLIRQFAQPQRWALYVDIDEFFDYPYSNHVPLPALLEYLRKKNYTTVLTHMLDMFTDQSLDSITSSVDDDLRATHRFYDLSNLVQSSYDFSNNHLALPDMKIYYSIRLSRYAPDGPGVILSKHPLFFLDGQIKPLFVHEHSVKNGKLADFTAVLYHYKYLGNFASQVQRAVQEKSYHKNSEQYKHYLRVIHQNPSLNLRQSTSYQLFNIQELIDNGFLQASSTFRIWASQHEPNA